MQIPSYMPQVYTDSMGGCKDRAQGKGRILCKEWKMGRWTLAGKWTWILGKPRLGLDERRPLKRPAGETCRRDQKKSRDQKGPR